MSFIPSMPFWLPLFGVTLAVTGTSPVPSLDWRSGPALPVARGGHAGGAVGGYFVVAGGTDWSGGEKVWLSSVFAYDASAQSWRKWPDLPGPLAYGAALETPDALYVAGGSDGRTNLRTILKLDGAGRAWTSEALPGLPEPRVFAAGAVLGRTLFVIGGARDVNDLGTCDSSLLRYRLDRPERGWDRGAPMPGASRSILAAAACGGAIYVFGGCHLDPHGTVVNLAEAYRYDPQGNRWRRLADLPRPLRGHGALALGDRFVLIVGGYETGPAASALTSAALVYDTVLDRYTPASEAPLRVMGFGAQIIGTTLFVAGGEDGTRHRSSGLAIGAIRWAR